MSTVSLPPRADYHEIVAHYESCLARYGDDHRGVDWPNPADAGKRYRVMLEVIQPQGGHPATVLDFGCGAAHLADHLQKHNRRDIEYIGLDISPAFIDLCRQKHPQLQFYCRDALQDSEPLPVVDYILMNGVFTEKRGLTFEAMFDYFRRLVKRVYPAARRGLAFNVMSKHVDWERDDLFHLPYDQLAAFLRAEISRNYMFRADYGLYEYTTYVYR
jgi:SAM-dependent methyltransferase